MNSSTVDVEITINPRKHQHRRGRPPSSAKPLPPRIPRITRLLALAIKFEELVRRGAVRDYADLARLGYVSRARITQIMNLLNLAPDLQEQILFLPCDTGHYFSEHNLRKFLAMAEWAEQRRTWAESH